MRDKKYELIIDNTQNQKRQNVYRVWYLFFRNYVISDLSNLYLNTYIFVHKYRNTFKKNTNLNINWSFEKFKLNILTYKNIP